MLSMQLQVLQAWWTVTGIMKERIHNAHEDVDRGEVTASTVFTVLIVVAAIAAGGVIATKITNNAKKVPEP